MRLRAASRLRSWAYALRTTNPPPDGPIDPVTRWLVVTRAALLPMTLFSGLVAALLAVGKPGLDWRWLVLAVVGITLAHTANNLMNDLYDTQVGTDTADYPRALYAPHPVLSGLVSRRTLGLAILLVNLADLAILVTLTWARGWPVVAFALSGFALSVAYTAPPLRLKKRGLGEPDVFVVWGPGQKGGILAVQGFAVLGRQVQVECQLGAVSHRDAEILLNDDLIKVRAFANYRRLASGRDAQSGAWMPRKSQHDGRANDRASDNQLSHQLNPRLVI